MRRGLARERGAERSDCCLFESLRGWESYYQIIPKLGQRERPSSPRSSRSCRLSRWWHQFNRPVWRRAMTELTMGTGDQVERCRWFPTHLAPQPRHHVPEDLVAALQSQVAGREEPDPVPAPHLQLAVWPVQQAVRCAEGRRVHARRYRRGVVDSSDAPRGTPRPVRRSKRCLDIDGRSSMRTIVPPPPVSRCEHCHGELRLKRVEPDCQRFVCMECKREQTFRARGNPYASNLTGHAPHET